jgi:hypothetical protein
MYFQDTINIYFYPENRGLTVVKGEITLVLLKNYYNQKCQHCVKTCISEKISFHFNVNIIRNENNIFVENIFPMFPITIST